MQAAAKVTHIKQSNLNIINSTLQGSKLFAYMRLLERKGTEVTEGRLKGARMLYLGGQDYIGAKFTTYPNGSISARMINGIIEE